MSDRAGNFEAESTAQLGNPATNYTVTFPGSGRAAPFGFRGLEQVGDPANMDGYTISNNRLSITVGMNVTEPGDWIRVVTNVPIPGAVWLLGSGLVGLIALRRKKKAQPNYYK